MKKQLLYLMFAAAVICAACGDDDEIINQIEVVENPVTGISVENEYITEEGDIVFDEVGITTTLRVSVIPVMPAIWRNTLSGLVRVTWVFLQ